MLSLFKPRQQKFFSAEDEQKIVDAIRSAEQQTSGEVRVFVESKNRFVDPLDRAGEIFFQLQMDKTSNHNAVLIYVATVHKEAAVFADEGIYKKAGQQFWNNTVASMLHEFKAKHYAEGLVEVVHKTGQLLKTYFPYDTATSKNELPDDIVFGK